MEKDGSLSEREKEVARILLQGKSNKQIALELGISTRTVEFHLRNLARAVRPRRAFAIRAAGWHGA